MWMMLKVLGHILTTNAYLDMQVTTLVTFKQSISTCLNMQVTTTKMMKPTFFSFLSDVRIKEKLIFNFFVDWCAQFVYVIPHTIWCIGAMQSE